MEKKFTIPYLEYITKFTHIGNHAKGKHSGKFIPKYTSEDFRFTQNEKILYAICMEWPGESAAIKTLGLNGKLYPNTIKSISLIGSKETLSWKQTPDALVVQLPKQKPCDYAYVLKIERI